MNSLTVHQSLRRLELIPPSYSRKNRASTNEPPNPRESRMSSVCPSSLPHPEQSRFAGIRFSRVDGLPIHSVQVARATEPSKSAQTARLTSGMRQQSSTASDWFSRRPVHTRGDSQVAKATDCKSVTRGFDSHSPLRINTGLRENGPSVFSLVPGALSNFDPWGGAIESLNRLKVIPGMNSDSLQVASFLVYL